MLFLSGGTSSATFCDDELLLLACSSSTGHSTSFCFQNLQDHLIYYFIYITTTSYNKLLLSSFSFSSSHPPKLIPYPGGGMIGPTGPIQQRTCLKLL